MYYSKSLLLIGVALVAPTAIEAFVLISPSRAHSSLDALRSTSLFASSTDDVDNDELSRRDATFKIVSAAATLAPLGLLFPAVSFAQVPTTAMQSSSVQLSAEIKTMDFSMPSSYDSIADPVAAGAEELTQTTVVGSGARKKAAPSGVSAKEEAAALRAERVAERKAREEEQAVKDAQSAEERDANIKAARLEKAAQRAAAAAEKKAAEESAKGEAKLKGVKFVDTSMPTY